VINMIIHLVTHDKYDALCGVTNYAGTNRLFYDSYIWHLANPGHLREPLDLRHVCSDCKDILPVIILSE